MLFLKSLCLIGAIFIGYFLPTIVAFSKNHHNKKTILILNLFLGWTALAWIVCLAMSFSKTDSPEANKPVSLYIIAPFALVFMFFIIPDRKESSKEEKQVLVESQKPQVNEEEIKQQKEADKKLAEEEIKKIPELLKKFKKEEDKIDNRIFYSHVNSYKGGYLRDNIFRIYLGVSGDNTWLRFNAYYNADDWLFIESFKINVDGENTLIIPNSYKERDTEVQYGGKIQEELNMLVEGDLESAISKVTADKPVVIRYNGKRYYHDKTLTKGEKQAIVDTLELKRLIDLKNKFSLEVK